MHATRKGSIYTNVSYLAKQSVLNSMFAVWPESRCLRINHPPFFSLAYALAHAHNDSWLLMSLWRYETAALIFRVPQSYYPWTAIARYRGAIGRSHTEVGVESPGRQDFSLRSRTAPLLQKLGPSSESRVRACPRLSTPTSVP